MKNQVLEALFVSKPEAKLIQCLYVEAKDHVGISPCRRLRLFPTGSTARPRSGQKNEFAVQRVQAADSRSVLAALVDTPRA